MKKQDKFDTLDDRTVFLDSTPDERFSAEELRKILELPKGDELSEYADLKAIGMGGLGAVFSVTEPGLNRNIALKVLRPEFRQNPAHIERFIKEARTTAQIDHPNVVPVHRIGVFDDIGVYFTMKQIEGETLRSVIKHLAEHKGKYLRRYSLRRRLEIFIAICQGVAFSHRKGIIHCDLKPSNIMIGDYGEVLIMDWGLARYHQEKDQSVNGKKMSLELDGDFTETEKSTSNGKKREISGTPAYMAPEQAAGHNEYLDERADVYSLGAILYSLLTLEPAPFDPSLDTNELLGMVILGRVVRPRRRAPRQNIPRELDAIVMKAMGRRRINRYPNVQSLIDDVRNFLDNYPVSAYSGPPFYRLIKLCYRRPLIPVTLVAALLTLGGVFLFRHLSDYYQEDSLLSVVHDNRAQSDARYTMAMQAFHQMTRDTGAVSEAAIQRREQIVNNFKTHSLEFYNRSNIALDALASLEDRNIRNEATLQNAGYLMKRQLQFITAVENYAQLPMTVQRFRSRWQNSFDRILRLDMELALLIRRIDHSEGVLTVVFPPELNVSIRSYAVDAAENSEEGSWTTINESEADRRYQAGNYLIRAQGTRIPAVYLPIIVGTASRQRLEIEIPPVFPQSVVFIAGGGFLYEPGLTVGNQPQVLLGGFFISRYEVTIAEYYEFYTQLRDPEERNKYMPRHITANNLPVELWDESGQLISPFTPNLPITGITGEAAEAYCRYLTRKTGLTHRLPTMLEFQKAARGVDGRTYVWGNRFRSDAALLRDNPQSTVFPVGAPPGSFPQDRSLYGVFDLAGNVREFIRSAGDTDPVYTVMGGSFRTAGAAAARGGSFGSTGYIENDIGFRYVIEIPRN